MPALTAPPEVDDLGVDQDAGKDLLDLTEPSPPADDPWSLTSTSKDKKKKKGANEEPKIEEVPLSKTKSKDSKSSAKAPVDDILDLVEEAEPEPAKEDKKAKKEEKSSSGWGSSLWVSSSSKKETSKEKKEREKREKKEKEEKEAADAAEAQRKADEEAFAAALGDEPNDILDELDAPPPPSTDDKKKSSKDRKKDDKAKPAKIESKSSKKSDSKEEPIVDVPEPAPIILSVDEAKKDELKKADGWGFWGASVKSTKKATAAPETKSKIDVDPWANQDTSVNGAPNMPDTSFGDDALAAAMSSPKSSPKDKKSSKGASIQDRIKALGAEDVKSSKSKKKDSAVGAAAVPPGPAPESEAIIEVVEEPELEKKSSKNKKVDKKSSKKSKELDALAPHPPVPASPVPGGFPADDLLDAEIDMSASPPKKSSKDKKSSSISKDTKKKSDPEPVVEDQVVVEEAAEIPTPPLEDSGKDKKSTKKDRPKVVRDQGSSSWGFWGATPTKKVAKKDEPVSPKTSERPTTGLSRSRSERKARDKDPLEKSSKSSGSDKDHKESKSRPSTSRSFSLFGTPTPSRSKSTRVPSSAAKSGSRRHSSAVEESGLVSPPPEKEMSAKAAKLMGVSRSKSTKEKKTRMIPDPYPIDSDDMIVVAADVPEDSAKDFDESRRQRKKSSRSKRQDIYMSGGLGDGDEVMVDAPRGSDEAKVLSGPDDTQFVERPGPPRRSSTMKKAGIMGGILGAFGAASRPNPERRQSKHDSEDAGPRRKRDSAYEEDRAKRLRREDRKLHRSSRKTSDGDGPTDAAPVTDVEAEEAREARRQERRERRAREEAEEAGRTARREERRRARAKEDEERQAREDEERRARRRARREEEDRLAREEEKAREERRERRRQRAEEEAAAAAAASSRPKTDRRRSYADGPEDEEARRMRREERRMRRSVDVGVPLHQERPRASRRHSEYPEQSERRNGEHTSPHGNGPIPAPLAHAIKTGGDKTASWVHSVNDDPPPPPPIEGTIIDAPVHFAEDRAPDPLDEGEGTTAREFRHRRRRDGEKDAYGDEAEERRRRRRDREAGVKSSDGSSRDRRKSYASNSMGYGDMGYRTYDGRPSMPARNDSKRGSWFKKIAGL